MLQTGRHAEFTEREAKALIGHTVVLREPFNDLRRGTHGRVISANLEVPQLIPGWALWRIVIQWEMPEGESPIQDWVAKWQVAQYMDQVE